MSTTSKVDIHSLELSIVELEETMQSYCTVVYQALSMVKVAILQTINPHNFSRIFSFWRVRLHPLAENRLVFTLSHVAPAHIIYGGNDTIHPTISTVYTNLQQDGYGLFPPLWRD